MSTIGYGDISPHTAPERLLGMLLMSAGCAFFAWITGRITQLLTKKSACEERFHDLMEDLETFMETRNFPTELRARVIDFYKVKYPGKRVFDQQLIIDRIESPSIKREILQHIYQDIVRQNALFSMLDDISRKEISFRLCAGYRMPGMWLTKAGTEPEALYVVRFGTIKLHADGLPTRHCSSGEMFGAIALLGLSPNGKRLYNSNAVSIVEFCSLSRDAFHELLACLPQLRDVIQKVSKMHIAGLRAAGIRAQEADILFSEAESHAFAAHCSSEASAGQDTWSKADRLRSERRLVKQQAERAYLDRLSNVRWRDIKARIDLQDQVAQHRKDQTSIDVAHVAALESASGFKILVTRLRFRIHSISFKTTSEVDAAEHAPLFAFDKTPQQGGGALLFRTRLDQIKTDFGQHGNGAEDDAKDEAGNCQLLGSLLPAAMKDSEDPLCNSNSTAEDSKARFSSPSPIFGIVDDTAPAAMRERGGAVEEPSQPGLQSMEPADDEEKQGKTSSTTARPNKRINPLAPWKQCKAPQVQRY